MDPKQSDTNPVNSYYKQIQSLSQANAQEPSENINQSTPASTNYALTAFYIFIGMLAVGILGLLLTRTRQLNKLIAVLVISLITSAIPLGLNLTKQQTDLTSQAGPELIPKNIIIANVTSTGFDISWETDKAQVSIVRISESPNMKLNPRIISGPEESKTSIHQISITKLEPNTTYYLEVLSGSEWYNFAGSPIDITTTQ